MRVFQHPLLNIIPVILIINVSLIAITISKTDFPEMKERNLRLPRLMCNNPLIKHIVYDEETKMWDSSPNNVTTFASGTTTGWKDANWRAGLDPDTCNVFANGGDMDSCFFSDNNRSWSEKTSVVKNVDSSGDGDKPTYDPSTDTLFATYILGTNIFIKKSTNGGVSWGSALEVTTASEDCIVVCSSFTSSPRVYVIYFDNENNCVYTNTISVIDNKSPIIKVFSVDDPGTGFPQFWANVTDGLELSDSILLLIIVGVVLTVLIILVVVARKRQQNKIQRKIREMKLIEEKISDIFSLGALFCRNMFGIPFYTESFVDERRDGELIAGLTTAMTNFLSQVAQRNIESGEFDVLERVGFSILSYHGEYSTTTLIAETKPSSYIKNKLVEITDRIERMFSRVVLQDSEISGTQEPIKKILYETLPLGLLKPLIVDEKRLKIRKKHFNKDEKKWYEYIKEVPSFVDGQQVFYAMTFITSLTLHGIPLAKAFSFLETCYELDAVRNLSEREKRFFEPVVAVEQQQL